MESVPKQTVNTDSVSVYQSCLFFFFCCSYCFTVKQAGVTNADTHCNHSVYLWTGAWAGGWVPEERMTVVAGPLLFPESLVWWSCRRLLPWLNVESKHIKKTRVTQQRALPCQQQNNNVRVGWHRAYCTLSTFGNSLQWEAHLEMCVSCSRLFKRNISFATHRDLRHIQDTGCAFGPVPQLAHWWQQLLKGAVLRHGETYNKWTGSLMEFNYSQHIHQGLQ